MNLRVILFVERVVILDKKICWNRKTLRIHYYWSLYLLMNWWWKMCVRCGKNWHNLNTKDQKFLISLNFYLKYMKLIQFGYKSMKIFDLSEFLFKVYEIDTIWIQKYENFWSLQIFNKSLWNWYNLDKKEFEIFDQWISIKSIWNWYNLYTKVQKF